MGKTPWKPLAAAVAIGVWMFLSPLGMASDDAYRDNDWFADRSWDALARDALLNHHQLPLRSHLVGGGFPTLGHPFDASWAPTMLPVLLFGDVVGVKINLLLLLLVGSWGIWGLAREWLGLDPPAATLATLAFAWAGWMPSMMLVGFYPQALYLLTPAILRLFWLKGERPRLSLLLAGFLLFMILQQAGNAVLAVAFFLVVATGLKVAAETRSWMPLPAVLLLLLVTAPLAFARELDSWLPVLLGWALAAGAIVGIPALRSFGRALVPWLKRGVLVALVAGTLGIGKVAAVADLLDRGHYTHELSWGWEFWFPRLSHGEADGRIFRWPRFDEDHPRPDYADPDYYEGPADLLSGLLWRAPTEGIYEPIDSPADGVAVEQRSQGVAKHEYYGVGATAPILLLALVGLVAGRRRRLVLGILTGVFSGICLGPHLLPDLHFLLVKGLPGFTTIVQPIKYFNFFLVPLLALLAGLGLDRLCSQRHRLAWATLPVFLALPFIHNGTALKERFKHPVEAGPVQEFHQLAQVGHPDWVSWEPEEIDRRGREHLLRELARPEQAREYWGVKRNVGIIDWYGTIEMDEAAIPSRYITPSGSLVDNPRYPGAEGWFSEGEGRIEALEIGPTRISARVETRGPARLVINQNHLPEFYVRGGQLAEVDGLLAVDIAGAGSHELQFRYRPMKLLLGLLVSFVAIAFWGWAVLREIRAPQDLPPSSGDPAGTPES